MTKMSPATASLLTLLLIIGISLITDLGIYENKEVENMKIRLATSAMTVDLLHNDVIELREQISLDSNYISIIALAPDNDLIIDVKLSKKFTTSESKEAFAFYNYLSTEVDSANARVEAFRDAVEEQY